MHLTPLADTTTRRHRTRARLIAAGLASLTVLAACGRDETNTAAARSTTTATEGGAAAPGTPAADAVGGNDQPAGSVSSVPAPQPDGESTNAATAGVGGAPPASVAGAGAEGAGPTPTIPAALLAVPDAAVALTSDDAAALASGVATPTVDRCAVGAALRTMLAANPASPSDSDAYVAALGAATRAAATALPAAIAASGANAAPDIVERVTAIAHRLEAEAAAGPGAATRLAQVFSDEDFDRLTDAVGFLVCERG